MRGYLGWPAFCLIECQVAQRWCEVSARRVKEPAPMPVKRHRRGRVLVAQQHDAATGGPADGTSYPAA
jgi:hypothetical protein